jgi:hypothetical protein
LFEERAKSTVSGRILRRDTPKPSLATPKLRICSRKGSVANWRFPTRRDRSSRFERSTGKWQHRPSARPRSAVALRDGHAATCQGMGKFVRRWVNQETCHCGPALSATSLSAIQGFVKLKPPNGSFPTVVRSRNRRSARYRKGRQSGNSLRASALCPESASSKVAWSARDNRKAKYFRHWPRKTSPLRKSPNDIYYHHLPPS